MRRQHPESIRTSGTPLGTNEYFLPCLIDRLRDDAPARQTETSADYAVTRAQMRDIVQRDLTFLLNASSLEDQISRKQYPHAATSTLNFGIPALAGSFSATRKWSEFEVLVRRAIREFEPRLISETIRVVPLSAKSGVTRYNQLVFEISGMIRVAPYPLEFRVQSSLDLDASRLHTYPR
ncbi:type VI secretion system protein ImpF [Paraburkholderia sp. GAS199]|uniref:type VI secretion system baseplate subunit TssE n=1 Tax=Paraburkholderia sp. GAS199 TaxID=3035126 RepID=UPI003D223A2C